MTEIKSQFLNTEESYGQDNMLLDSLNLITADSRSGLDTENTERLKRMSDFVEKSGDTVKQKAFNEYAEKISSGVATTKTVQKKSYTKPSGGMM